MTEETKKVVRDLLVMNYYHVVESVTRLRVLYQGQDMSYKHEGLGETRQQILKRFVAEESAAFAALTDFDPTWVPDPSAFCICGSLKIQHTEGGRRCPIGHQEKA